jgi:hypothetical protein
MRHSGDIDVPNIEGRGSAIFRVFFSAVLFSKFPFSGQRQEI